MRVFDSTPFSLLSSPRPAFGFLAAAGLALTLVSCHHADVRQALRSQALQAPQGPPVMLAAYQPWFGNSSHINVGYSSQDERVLERQIAEAKDLGIRGFVVNWYGPNKNFEDRSYALLQRVAGQDRDYRVALMYDEDDGGGDTTNQVIGDLQYAYDRYIGSRADGSRSAYLRYNGRPVIFIFPKGGATDWSRVRRATDSWDDPPLLLYKDGNSKYASDFDGFYAWVQPGRGGWQRDGSNWGRDYLDSFYARMSAHYPDKIAVGAAWPGFDDSRASWTRNRRMNARCGKTFEDSLGLFRRYYSDQKPLPFLMIVTWNDYEEGTAIERGVVRCGGGESTATAGR